MGKHGGVELFRPRTGRPPLEKEQPGGPPGDRLVAHGPHLPGILAALCSRQLTLWLVCSMTIHGMSLLTERTRS